MLEQSTAQHLDRTDPESPQVQAQKAQTEPFFFLWIYIQEKPSSPAESQWL